MVVCNAYIKNWSHDSIGFVNESKTTLISPTHSGLTQLVIKIC